MLICQMAAWYKAQGKTLIDGLNEIYAEYGYFLDALDPFVLKGKDGAEKINSLMDHFRKNGLCVFEGADKVIDYSKGVDDLPIENVLKFVWEDGSWVAVRPSGTEPKIKIYYSVREENREKAHERLEKIRTSVKNIIEG